MICPVCEHDQQAGDSCDVCGKQLSGTKPLAADIAQPLVCPYCRKVQPATAAAPLVPQDAMTVRGVLSPSGPNVSGASGAPLTVLLRLRPWRTEGGTLMCTTFEAIRIGAPAPSCSGCGKSLPLARSDAENAFSALEPLSIVELKCGPGSFKEPHNARRAELFSAVSSRVSDPELQKAADDLARSKTVHSPLFGTLVLDRMLNWLEGETTTSGWGRHKIRIDRTAEDDDTTEDHDEQNSADAEAMFRELVPRLPGILDRVVAELLPLYNDTWREPDAPLETAESLRRRLQLSSILLYPPADGLELSFTQEGLFTDHIVQADVGPDGSISVSLAG